MSRTLRFRCWDKVAGLYLSNGNWTGINQDGNPWLVIEGKDVLDGSDRWVVEQYTGLKDKNGREIYEGDILQNADGETATVVWCEETAEWGIEWSDCEVRDSLSWRMTCVKESDSLNEVIGNIHENRDLLGGEE